MPPRRYTLLDVFTATPLTGNALAVVHEADGLDDATMLAFARETRLSETTFVQSPTAAGADYRNRIWMMTGEIPFAGHPSLGTAVAVARERGEDEGEYVQQTVAGCQPVRFRIEGARAHASMLQEAAVYGPQLDPGEVAEALGVPTDALDARHPPQVVGTGVAQVIAPFTPEGLAQIVRPDYARIDALLAPHGGLVIYAAAFDAHAGTAHARAFTGSGDIGEDPATGSACGPLLAYLADREGVHALTVRQGIEMGRPSLLRASIEDGRVRVSGGAVVVVDGTVVL